MVKVHESSPWFPWFPSKWLQSLRVRCLTPAARGYYMDMLCYMWSQPGAKIPNDKSVFISLCPGINEADIKAIMGCMTVTEDNFLVQDFQQEVLADVRERLESSSKGGKRTAEKRKKKEEERKERMAKLSIEERQKAFKEELNDYHKRNPGKYPIQLYESFYNWWTQLSKDKKKLGFEMQKTWSLPARLATFYNREPEKYDKMNDKKTKRIPKD